MGGKPLVIINYIIVVISGIRVIWNLNWDFSFLLFVDGCILLERIPFRAHSICFMEMYFSC